MINHPVVANDKYPTIFYTFSKYRTKSGFAILQLG